MDEYYAKVASGTTKGTASKVIPLKDRAAFSAVANQEQAAKAVEQCGRHIQSVCADIEKQSNRIVSAVTVGKTYLPTRVGYKLRVQNPNSWVKKGMNSRWGSTYHPKGYDGLVLCVPFSVDDLHPVAKANFGTPESLALGYEDKIAKWLETAVRADVTLDNKDEGGGGRTSGGRYAAYGVYIAFKLAERIIPELNINLDLPEGVTIATVRANKTIKVPVLTEANKKVLAKTHADKTH